MNGRCEITQKIHNHYRNECRKLQERYVDLLNKQIQRKLQKDYDFDYADEWYAWYAENYPDI